MLALELLQLRQRLHPQPPVRPYYLTPDMLLADLYLMCENCRLYNSDTTMYWECATRLESFARNRAAELSVTRVKPAEEGVS